MNEAILERLARSLFDRDYDYKVAWESLMEITREQYRRDAKELWKWIHSDG